MADLKIKGQTTSRSFEANGQQIFVTGTRDGAIYTCDYILGLSMAGRLFNASVGTATGPITFGAYDELQPELVVDVPSGTTIIPVFIEVHLENSAGTDNEILMVTATNNKGAGTSTAITPVCSRRNAQSTRCSVYSAYSGNGTAGTGTNEFFRWGNAFADANTVQDRVIKWTYNMSPQVIDGAGSLIVYVSATSTQADGFIKVAWAEFASSEV